METRKKNCNVMVRLSSDEKKQLETLAHLYGVSISECLRLLIAKAAKDNNKAIAQMQQIKVI